MITIAVNLFLVYPMYILRKLLWYMGELMKFKVKAQMWGNSLGMRIPKMIAEKLRWSDASQLELEIRGESLIVRRQRTHSYELDDLLRDITPQNSHAEIKTGERRGGESW